MIKVLTVCPAMNDDDVDFKPSQSTSSNLTSLFDANKPNSSGNVSLTYTAPKAPKEGEAPPQQNQSTSKSASNGKLNIITSTTVQIVYKLENEKYVNQGTAGAAIVGNYDLHMYQIILYKSNKDHICKTVISTNFSFTILENNYASFYDSSGQNWLILFSSSGNAQSFAKQVAIAKFNSQKTPEKIVVQDLVHVGANKNKAKNDDVIKLKCDSFMLNKDESAPLKEKSDMSVELGSGESFPWHEGLKDCTEQCQRIVIVPQNMSAPWTEEIPPTAALLLELKVESITASASTSAKPEKKKLQKGGNTAKNKEEIQADSSGDEDHSKEKECTLQERVLLSRIQKMDLITRIAKMGHALPLKGPFISEPCELEEESYSSAKSPKKLRTGNNAMQFNQSVPADPCPCHQNENDSGQKDPKNQQMVTMTFQRSGVNVESQPMFPYVTGPGSSKDNETGQAPVSRNTELGLRRSIDKISEKVDHVLNKLEHLDFSTKEKTKELPDTVGVGKTIQDVITENETLKNDVKVMKSKIDEQNRKIQSLMDLTQSCVDKCSLTAKKHGDAQEKVLDLEENAKSSDHSMVEATSRINQLTSYVDHYKKELSENQNRMKEANLKLLELTEKLKMKEEKLQNMEEELNRIRNENKSFVNLNESRSRDTFSNKSEDFGEGVETSKSASEDFIYDEIKKVMNAINRRLQSSFENDKSYSGSDVKDKIARTIKGVFMAYMKYKGKGKSISREDVRAGAEKTSGTRETSSQGYSAEKPDSDRHRKSDDPPRMPVSRIKFADDQESEINRVDENYEEVKPHEVDKKSTPNRTRADLGEVEQSGRSHLPQKDSGITSGMVRSGNEEAVSNAEKSKSHVTKESRTRSQGETLDAEKEIHHAQTTGEFSKKSKILDQGSNTDSRPRHSHEHEVGYGESFDEISKKSVVSHEAVQSRRSPQSPRFTSEPNAQHRESAEELFKKSEILDNATNSFKDSQIQRSAFKDKVEREENVDGLSKKSGAVDEEAAQSVTDSQIQRSAFKDEVEQEESPDGLSKKPGAVDEEAEQSVTDSQIQRSAFKDDVEQEESADVLSRKSTAVDEEAEQSVTDSQIQRSAFKDEVEQEESPDGLSRKSTAVDEEAEQSVTDSQIQRSAFKDEVEQEESPDGLSRKSTAVDEEAVQSVRESESRRPTFEEEVKPEESADGLSRKSTAVDEEAVQSVRESESRRPTFEEEVKPEENVDGLSRKSTAVDEEAVQSVRGSESRRPTFKDEVEHEESVKQVDEHSKESEILDEGATSSVTGPISDSPSHERSDASIESKTDNSIERHSTAKDGSVLSEALSEIQNVDNLGGTSSHEIENEKQNTSQTNSQMSILHSSDQLPTSRKSTNENGMNKAPSDTHRVSESVTSGNTVDKTPLEVMSTTFQEPVLKSILKNRETAGSTTGREENDTTRSRTSYRLEDETTDGKSEASINHLSTAPSGNDGEFDKISGDDSSSTPIQKLDLESNETQKSTENLSNEPSSDFNNSNVQTEGSGMDRKSVEEKSSSKESVKQEEDEEEKEERRKSESEKRESTSETPSDSNKTSVAGSIKKETLETDTGTKEDNEDDGTRINNEEEKVESSESESSDSPRNSIPEKGGTDDVSDGRSENGPPPDPPSERDQPGHTSASGLSDLNNLNGTMRNFGTKRSPKEEDGDGRDSKESMKENADEDSLTMKISYIIKEGEIEPTSVKSSTNEGFMKNYFRSLTEISLEENVPEYYERENEKRMEFMEEERANEENMQEEGENDNYKAGLISSKKNVTFSPNPNWGTSVPPPLPLDGEDSSSQDDEEWL